MGKCVAGVASDMVVGLIQAHSKPAWTARLPVGHIPSYLRKAFQH